MTNGRLDGSPPITAADLQVPGTLAAAVPGSPPSGHARIRVYRVGEPYRLQSPQVAAAATAPSKFYGGDISPRPISPSSRIGHRRGVRPSVPSRCVAPTPPRIARPWRAAVRGRPIEGAGAQLRLCFYLPLDGGGRRESARRG